MADSRLSELGQARASTDAYREAETRAFLPADTMEALALRVIGGWENLLAEVNWTRFHVAGYDAGKLDREGLAKALRDIADSARVRWPHQQWAGTATEAKRVRDRLAHMLFITSIAGEQPNRTMNFMMLGAPDVPRKGPDGTPGELSWRDAIWSAQQRQVVAIEEQELIGVLAGIRWMLDCCRDLNRLRDIIANPTADLPDDKVIDPFMWQVNWWLPEWGPVGSAPITVGMVRLQPGETNTP